MSEKMTIAQALRRIKKIKGQIAEHQERARAGVSYDISKVPAFRFAEADEAMQKLQTELVGLESSVAVANAQGTVQFNGKSVVLAAAIRTLQELKGRIAFLKGLHLRNETVQARTNDWDDTEMKHISRVTETTYKSDLSEQDRDRQVKALQDQFESLNNAVENANHTFVVV
jgi:hypothetical protein